MTWCSRFDSDDHDRQIPRYSAASLIANICPSCGHPIQALHQARGNSAVYEELPGLPAGVKFDPTDQELLEHLEGKSKPDLKKLHPLIDDFIPTIQGHTGICYTHPEKLPGVTRDGLIRHFFHRPSKAYTTGTRKRRKIHTNDNGCETRWHKTGKTRPVLVSGKVKGYKKILVLYNYGKQRKPEKTNWVMHQYHLGSDEEERDGELIVSKIFYQTQPRQCNSVIMMKDLNFKKRFKHANEDHNSKNLEDESIVKHYSSSQISYNKKKHHTSSPPHLMHNLIVPSRESLCLN